MAHNQAMQQDILSQARAAHEQGNALKALELYRAVLAEEPNHIEALNVCGMLLAGQGKLLEGLAVIEQAVAADSRVARSHFHHGVLLEQLRRYNQALESLNLSVMLDPTYAPAFDKVGVTLARLGRYEEALAAYNQAIRRNPFYAEAYSNMGNALQKLGRADEALACYAEAIQIAPENAFQHNNKGAAFKALNKLEEARVEYEKAIALKPDYAHAHNNLGVVFKEQGKMDEALASLHKAIAIAPEYADPYSNLGTVLEYLGRYDEALASYNKALSLNPDYAEAYSNMGFTLQKLCRYDEALAAYDKAIAMGFRNAAVFFNKGFALLLIGQFREGWELFEWRWKRDDVVSVRFTTPAWTGKEDIAGKTLLLHAEQGLGDAIQFCRYVPMVQALGAKVLLRVHAPLIPLFTTLASKPDLLELKQEAPHDYHCQLMSLPHIFNTELATIPADIPYLFADEGKCNEWKQRLGKVAGKRIGVVWAGNPNHKNDHNRSVALDVFSSLFAGVKGAEFHSVQKEIREEDAPLLAQHGVQLHQQHLKDFTDTAAFLMQLDVVITVDTAVAHLAGALGRPVWILIPFAPDFRWMTQRTDNPWYPSVRLFRQKAPSNWAPVIAEVTAALKEEGYGR